MTGRSTTKSAFSGSAPLTVVAPHGYPWRFNGPRQSRHTIRIRRFAPFSRIRQVLDGVTVFSPLDTFGADLIHAFNRIPLNRTPFVIGFESHIPRAFGLQGTAYEDFLVDQLAAGRCRRIIAISQYAAGHFRRFLERRRDPMLSALLHGKLELRYPNLPVGDDWGEEVTASGELVVTFVGNHFARKGGCAAVRMADICLRRKLPVRFNIVSTVQCGGVIWSDPTNQALYEPYRQLLALPNVTLSANLPNAVVQEMLRNSHFLLLTTFSDTFGFSALEAMAAGTPVIATAQGALPEFIDSGTSGELLDPARTPGQSSWMWDFDDRASPSFEKLFVAENERLAAEGVERLVRAFESPDAYRSMRKAAHRTVYLKFNSLDAQAYWDRLYVEALASPGPQPVAAGEQGTS